MSTELDFHGIKARLKEYISRQEDFTDFNFEGSNLSFLLDILAYNTHYNALYANMIVNEQFLDSAIKRANVVSLAKHLGYVPRSPRAAGVLVDISVNSEETVYNIPRFTTLTGSKEGKSLSFVTTSPLSASSSTGTFLFEDVELKQGKVVTWNFDVTEENQKFTLPSKDIDLTTLSVTVRPTTTSEFSRYQQGNYFRNYDQESLIYFVEEDSRGFYILYFGDGIIGRPVEAGNRITARYIVTAGDEGNDIKRFTAQGPFSITVSDGFVSGSRGGADRESIESIKFNAPRFYSSQGRAITAEDYKSIILSEIPKIESINIWGGETETPPRYGRVFITIKAEDSDRIDKLLERQVYSILADRGVVSIDPHLVDPDYIYVGFDINVWFDKKIEARTKTIEDTVRTAIDKFFDEHLQKFDKDFRYSKFIRDLDDSSEAIDSILINISIQKRLRPQGVQNQTFNNSIQKGSIGSSVHERRVFGLPKTGTVKDDDGELLFFYEDKTLSVGSINYETGEFSVNFNDYIGPSSRLRLHAKISDNSRNINTRQNQILVKNDDGIDITIQEIALA